MNKALLNVGFVVTSDSDERILKKHLVEIDSDRIVSIQPYNAELCRDYPGVVYDFSELTLIPGFIQTHVHLSQVLFRGLAEDMLLLDWLKKRIFPMENRHTEESLRISAQLGILELLQSGTTTILDIGTLRHHHVIFEELIRSGMRAYSGNCLMDENDLYPDFKLPVNEQIRMSEELIKTYHHTHKNRIGYAVTPRFVPSCSEVLLHEAVALSKEHAGVLLHTHASENKSETDLVKKKTGFDNIEYLGKIGLLTPSTVLAHCIHVSKKEKVLLREKETSVAHCPSANMKLGSGVAPIPDYLERGINVSIGADGAPCNNSLSPFIEMRLAGLIQKPLHGPEVMNAKTLFKMATINGAKALHLENETGSIEVGKKADFVLLNLNTPDHSPIIDESNILSNIVYSSQKEHVKHVIVDGQWLVQNGGAVGWDEIRIFHNARTMLKNKFSDFLK